MKEHFTTQVIVNGKGATRQQAFAAALSQVQPTLLKGSQHVMLRLEPVDVQVIKAEESVRVEKFLFFFLPRQRREFRVQLEIAVKVTSLDVDKVDFTLL
ncbi:DUF4312 family protein [Aeromonas lusitana]|uniref:Cytoplasmic protein n=1 Tax=Aeromonas lusitana TaxID=931529 RepID=A0A2M8H7M0_9GAMM|nr:DUF4312 family protein [Aeromonas lusitana]PJC92535.1 cytoplasmic protein [Aeromonas lusitana]